MPGEIVAERKGFERLALAGQSPKEFLLVHVVFESLSAVDEHHGNFVAELPAKFEIHVNVDLLPGKSAAARKLRQAFFHHLAQVASFAGIDNNGAGVWHAARL
jgi:hypothetical protein